MKPFSSTLFIIALHKVGISGKSLIEISNLAEKYNNKSYELTHSDHMKKSNLCKNPVFEEVWNRFVEIRAKGVPTGTIRGSREMKRFLIQKAIEKAKIGQQIPLFDTDLCYNGR